MEVTMGYRELKDAFTAKAKAEQIKDLAQELQRLVTDPDDVRKAINIMNLAILTGNSIESGIFGNITR